MNIEEIVNYFKGIATEHKEILHSENEPHFFRDMDEAIEKLKSKSYLPAFILGPPVFDVADKNQDNTYDEHSLSFLLVDYVSMDDFKGKIKVYDKMLRIGRDIIARMRYEACTCDDSIKQFETDRVHIEPVGPILDNYYGMIFEFYMMDFVDLEYDSGKWLIVNG